jgi:serine/threonine-protein kinase HipA
MDYQLAKVFYRQELVGMVSWDRDRRVSSFEYARGYLAQGHALAPLQMPVRRGVFQFPKLPESFAGLPGLLADCLPDAFGHALIDEWLRSQNRRPDEFTPLDRLCYVGDRGMGALEFRPTLRPEATHSEQVDVADLVALASRALARKENLRTDLESETALNDILRVGTSAGGARAKAIIGWNPITGEVRSGQTDVPAGFSHWLLKFDGVNSSFDGVQDPQGYGRIEYAYALMAKVAGLEMMPCRLHEEGGRAHFMTRRFDRTDQGGKLHYASLFGLAHMDYTAPGAQRHSYEDYFEVIHRLDLAPSDRLQAFQRMVFNILGCNRDDHVKNFGFLMSETGQWRLSPAFDITYAHNPAPGKWTATQQMSVRGKRDSITREDLIALGHTQLVATKPKLNTAIDQVVAALQQWPTFADTAKVAEDNRTKIAHELQRMIASIG